MRRTSCLWQHFSIERLNYQLSPTVNDVFASHVMMIRCESVCPSPLRVKFSASGCSSEPGFCFLSHAVSVVTQTHLFLLLHVTSEEKKVRLVLSM